jgi:hypothetical protein
VIGAAEVLLNHCFDIIGGSPTVVEPERNCLMVHSIEPVMEWRSKI